MHCYPCQSHASDDSQIDYPGKNTSMIRSINKDTTHIRGGLGFLRCVHIAHFICWVSSPHTWGLAARNVMHCLTIGSGHTLGSLKLPVDLQQMVVVWKHPCLQTREWFGNQVLPLRDPPYTIPGHSAVLPRAQYAYTPPFSTHIHYCYLHSRCMLISWCGKLYLQVYKAKDKSSSVP